MRRTCVAAVLFAALALRAGEPEPRWSGREAIEEAVRRRGLEGEWKRLGEELAFIASHGRLATSPSIEGDRVLPVVERVLQRDPLSLVDESRALLAPLEAAVEREDAAGALLALARASGLEPALPDLPPAPGKKAKAEEAVTWLVAVIEKAAELRELALERIPAGERAAVLAAARAPCDALCESFYLEARPQRMDAALVALRAGGKLDRAAMASGGMALARLAERETLVALGKALASLKPDGKLRRPGCEGPLLLVRETAAGALIVGGKGKNRWDGRAAGAALIVDVGGDDEWIDAGAAGLDAEAAVRVAIDLQGADTWRAGADGRPGSSGSGVLGLGLAVDLQGNDRYEGARFAQGVGLLGVGALVDLAGDDRYQATEVAQGAGAFGLGLLLDAAGNDDYQAALFAQGVGYSLGAGAKADRRGDDRHAAGGVHPSTYGTAGQFHAMSLGVGIGFRGLQEEGKRGFGGGGVGIALDLQGSDRWSAGEFGLGCGYHLGLGIARDAAGDDEWLGSRYGLASGAHQALGVLLEGGGNDRYRSPAIAGLAGVWDGCVAALLDEAGDDHYEAAALCMGAAAIRSLAVLHDQAGDDQYRAQAADAQGDGGNGEDVASRCVSAGVLLDDGGRDAYSRPGPEPRRDGGEGLTTKPGEPGQGPSGLGLFLDREQAVRAGSPRGKKGR